MEIFWIQPKNHVMENHTMENHVIGGITVIWEKRPENGKFHAKSYNH